VLARFRISDSVDGYRRLYERVLGGPPTASPSFAPTARETSAA
jgi:hypothetical protein